MSLLYMEIMRYYKMKHSYCIKKENSSCDWVKEINLLKANKYKIVKLNQSIIDNEKLRCLIFYKLKSDN